MEDTKVLLEEFEALKAKGWTKLSGEERTRYKELKAKFPELEGDSAEPEDTNSNEEEKTEEKKVPQKKAIESTEKLFELLGTFRHNGTEYRKGMKFPANHELHDLAPKDIIKEL